MEKALEKTLGLLVIAIWVGIAINSVGETSKPSLYTWTFPFSVFINFFVVWILGYWAGKDN